MSIVIGLIGSEAAALSAVEKLKEAELSEAKINITANSKSVNELFGCDPACIVKNYAILGAAIGLGVYAVFGLAAALCQCNLMQFGQPYGFGALFGATLAGIFVGGGIGLMIGAGEAEKDTQRYVQGVRAGAKLISVQVPPEKAEQVKHLLVIQNVQDVLVLQPSHS